MRRLLPIVLFAACLPIANAVAEKTKTPPALGPTYIETLDMSSPQATAGLFVQSLQTGDFVTAFFLLSPDAKQGFSRAINEFRTSQLFVSGEGDYVGKAVFSGPKDLMWDVSYDEASLFSAMMREAYNRGRLPFDLMLSELGQISPGAEGIVVVAIDGAVPAGLALETKILSNGQWRVERVVWDGSAGVQLPWDITPPATQ